MVKVEKLTCGQVSVDHQYSLFKQHCHMEQSTVSFFSKNNDKSQYVQWQKALSPYFPVSFKVFGVGKWTKEGGRSYAKQMIQSLLLAQDMRTRINYELLIL